MSKTISFLIKKTSAMPSVENNQTPKEGLQVVTPKDLNFEEIEVKKVKNGASEDFLIKGIQQMRKEKKPCAIIFEVIPVRKPVGVARQDFDGTNKKSYTSTGFKVVCTKMLEALGFMISEAHIVKPVAGYEGIFVVSSFPKAIRA